MKVYFDASLWNLPEAVEENSDEEVQESVEENPCEDVQEINAEFIVDGLKHVIPAIYCFTKGIVFDILTVMEEEVMAENFSKYENYEQHQDTITQKQLELIWQDNPYQSVDGRYWINGESTGNLSSTCDGYLRGRLPHGDVESIQKLKEAYLQYLEEADCFFCQRICIENGTDYTKEKITELKLRY